MKTILRQTNRYTATPAKTPGRVTIKASKGHPRQRTVSPKTWAALSAFSDKEFDGACCLELGIGAFDSN